MSAAGFAESIDRRVLGGFFFVDAITNASITGPLRVTSTQLDVRANRSGIYVIFNGPGFNNLTTQFIPDGPTWPNSQSFEIGVQDPSLRYLARRAQVQAPQNLATIFNPQPIVLYPGVSTAVEPNWAVVRVSVIGSNGSGLPWAVLRVIRSDNSIAATGMTDSRGEALLAVNGLGVQVSANSTGSVTETTIPVTVQAWFDPGVLSRLDSWIPNPDDILSNLSNTALKTATFTGALGARQVLFASVTISL